MKISGRKGQTPIGGMTPLGGAAHSEPQNETTASSMAASDQVSLGSSTQVRKLAQAAQALPTVRTEKVAQLRSAIDDGSYHVESEKLARRVVDEALRDALNDRLR